MTAVEWLEQELKKLPFVNVIDVFNKAKQMEKQQMVTNDNHLTDEEIQFFAYKYKEDELEDSWEAGISFMDGAKWYREQLKQRQ